jgi:hypothetical protein
LKTEQQILITWLEIKDQGTRQNGRILQLQRHLLVQISIDSKKLNSLLQSRDGVANDGLLFSKSKAGLFPYRIRTSE